MTTGNIFGFSMFVLLVSAGIYLLILILQYLGMRKVYRYNRGMILLTYIPKEYSESPEVNEIVSSAKKYSDKIFLVFLLLAIPMAFTKIIISMKIMITCVLLYILIQGIFLNKHIYKLRDWKKENCTIKSNKKYVDINVSNIIENESVNMFMWFIPIAILTLNEVVASILNSNYNHRYLYLYLIVLISIMMFALLSKNKPIKIVSDDKEKNIEYNRLLKVYTQSSIFNISCILSVVFSIFIHYSKIDEFSMWLFIVPIAASIILSLYVLYRNENIERKSKMYIDEDYIYDEGDYYDAFGYSNPNTNKIFISNPISNSNFCINRGNKVGKIINYLVYVILFVAILPVLIMSVRDYKVEENKDYLKISADLFYKDEIKYSDIENVRILEDIPEGRIIKINGFGSDDQNFGTFKIKNIGKVVLYIYDDSGKILEIKRKNNYPIYYEGKSDLEIENLYKSIKSKL